MLEVEGLRAGYGSVEILHDITFRVPEGAIVSLVGANGAGKSTCLRTISGLLKPWGGTVRFQGEGITGLDPAEIVERGISQVPEGRQLFANMTVQENLEVGSFLPAARARRQEGFERVYTLFPRLRERANQIAGTMSGGEQQMLAIGRALMAHPKLLIFDEPSLGLAPILVAQLFEAVKAINESGVTVLLVEQNLVRGLELSDYAYVLEQGTITLEGKGEDLLKDERTRRAYLGA